MRSITKILLSVISAAFLLQGCATIFSSSSQVINIKAVDNETNQLVEGCICTVTDGAGGTFVVTSNPGPATVQRSQGALQVNCRKEGYRQINTSVGDSFNAASMVNVLFWPGFLVDFATGAYKKYPSHYLVQMERIKLTTVR